MNYLRLLPASARVVSTLLALALGGFALTPRAFAQANAFPPERMAYQSYLVDANGTPLATNAPKNYDLIFRIWNDPTTTVAINRLWTEQQTVVVDKGYFSVVLGEGSSIGEARPNLSTIFANATASDRWVAITIKGIGAGGSDVNILPRLRLLASPYSFLATTAVNVSGSGTIQSANLAASAVDSSKIADGTIVDADVSASAAIADTKLATIATVGKVANSATTATSANTPSAIVARDASGNFTAGTVTATAFNGGGAGLTSLNGTNLMAASVDVTKLVAAVQQALCPPGTILAYAGDTAPAGWLLCNGTAYGTASYPALYAVIGYRFGNLAGNFYVPDLRGRFLRGRANGATLDPDRATRTAMNAGGAAGDAVGSVQGDALQNIAGSIGEFNLYAALHGTSTPPFWRTNVAGSTGIGSGGGDPYTKVNMDLSLSARTATETRPVNAYVNYIIKY